MAINPTNKETARLLRSVAAALTLKKLNLFQIRAYENAADSIEHLDSEIKDIWEEGKFNEVPGIGKNLQEHLDELFKTGKVKHFGELKKGLNPVIFDLLDISGVGPKTAKELADLGVKNLKDLEEKIKNSILLKKGFSAKISEKILSGIQEFSQRSERMLLPYAFSQAQKILAYLKKCPYVQRVDPLGSLRRQVATIGDLDFSAASDDPSKVIEYFIKMPGISRIASRGDSKATIILSSGIQADILVGKPESYGSLLQHFTGSKNHNIHLRNVANEKGYSLSEYGVKRVQGVGYRGQENIIHCRSEEELYSLLGIDTPPPEIREDTGEIEAAIEHKLPELVELKNIKGDFHLHSNYPIDKPSHAPGVNTIEEIAKKADRIGYKYIGISDHSPSFTSLSKEQIIKSIARRTKSISLLSTKDLRVLNGLEIDILGDGSLSVPDEALQTLDYCIASIHSGHRGSKEILTKRILKTLANPYVDILGHPTNRLLNKRESSDADWEAIFKFCARNKKLLEINGYPDRLDLRDDLVRTALSYGCKFIINTDAHEVFQMDNMPYGVSVARRGWVTSQDVANTWDLQQIMEWFNIK